MLIESLLTAGAAVTVVAFVHQRVSRRVEVLVESSLTAKAPVAVVVQLPEVDVEAFQVFREVDSSVFDASGLAIYAQTMAG